MMNFTNTEGKEQSYDIPPENSAPQPDLLKTIKSRSKSAKADYSHYAPLTHRMKEVERFIEGGNYLQVWGVNDPPNFAIDTELGLVRGQDRKLQVYKLFQSTSLSFLKQFTS
jgi:hypothetical protein